jgi:hypothetical protein
VACRAIWGHTLDDFTDDDLSAEDPAWLDRLTQECAVAFAAEQGYDLREKDQSRPSAIARQSQQASRNHYASRRTPTTANR